MTNERWQRVRALFETVLDRPADERDGFLRAATAGDEALRIEVESLLASDALRDQWFEQLPMLGEATAGDVVATPLPAIDDGFSQSFVATGSRIGPYEIVALLGAGSMGQVYKARDTRLNREVALKVLPGWFARDAARLARFKREAHVLAMLNHTNIASIYGVEESDGLHALALELVEGTTLAERIALGPIPLTDALMIARQMAEAFEAAHEKRIIHRDPKPANICISHDGVVKVLDFGLAKVCEGAEPPSLSGSPSLTATDGFDRTILGTPAYMSPEQARGQSLDRRTDIWSFGCVLYEMLTGHPAFTGDTISDTLAAILEHEPDFTRLPADTPVPIRRLLRRCLEKNRDRRLDSAAAIRLEIDDAHEPAPIDGRLLTATRSRGLLLATTALLCIGVIAALIRWTASGRTRQTPALPSRFTIVLPPEPALNISGASRDVALSPDGRTLVYRAGGSTTAGSALLLRPIDRLDMRPISSVTNGYAPFFSPDSRWIGFFEKGLLKKIEVTGGPVSTLCEFGGSPFGGTWGDDNTITFATGGIKGGLWRVSADGGVPTRMATPPSHDETYAFPSLVPRSRGVLFTIVTGGPAGGSEIAVIDPLRTGKPKVLIRGGADAQYVDSGHLVFASGGALHAVPFDPIRLETTGEPVTALEDVLVKASGAANYAMSRDGTLVYMPSGLGRAPLYSLVWVDRNGREEELRTPARFYGPGRISPDGTRIAIGIKDQGSADVWIFDVAGGALKRLIHAPGTNGLPLWTPDGRRIIFSMMDRAGVLNLYSQAADGTGGPVPITSSPIPCWPTSVMPDGGQVFGFELGVTQPAGVFAVPISNTASRPGGIALPNAFSIGIQSSWAPGSSETNSVPRTLFDGSFAEISPDGRYIAYQSNESGRYEVYVRRFPDAQAPPWQVSTAGGTRPTWSRDGRDLFFIDEANALTAVPVKTAGAAFVAGAAARLLDGRYLEPNPARHYDVSPDGRRFLMIKPASNGDPNVTPAGLVVVVSWLAELRSHASAK